MRRHNRPWQGGRFPDDHAAGGDRGGPRPPRRFRHPRGRLSARVLRPERDHHPVRAGAGLLLTRLRRVAAASPRDPPDPLPRRSSGSPASPSWRPWRSGGTPSSRSRRATSARTWWRALWSSGGSSRWRLPLPGPVRAPPPRPEPVAPLAHDALHHRRGRDHRGLRAGRRPAGWSASALGAAVVSLSRYTLLFPGAVLSAVGLWRQRSELSDAGMTGIRPYAARRPRPPCGLRRRGRADRARAARSRRAASATPAGGSTPPACRSRSSGG